MDLDRRAGLVLAGSLVFGSAAASAKEAGKGGEDVPANEDLMREHGVLRRILVVYRETAPKLAATPAPETVREIRQAALLFRDFGERYHEETEEKHVFPVVKRASGAVAALPDVLTAQHKRGREITEWVIATTASGEITASQGEAMARSLIQFCRMYEEHAALEDTLVFPAFRKGLSKARYDALGDQFEAIEHAQFKGDGLETALARISHIEHALGLSDLTAFTAPPPPA